jgi:hypothetical protein
MSNFSTASNNLYDLYVKACKDLAQSIQIKFDAVAQGINQEVLLKTGVLADEQDPASWKYYQNICGQYHSSDTAMSVYSLDTESVIAFTVSALAQNPVTKAAYAFGSTYYNDLLAAYPDQEMLILGILYPVQDIQTAIAAKDGTILAYPTHLVEDDEVDFIRLLQAWLYAHIGRWFNPAYTITDDLYMAAFLGQLTLSCIAEITNIRLAACKTNQAHSFHINQYLRSHGFLDTYLRQMTRKQALDMYRNINYYERNAGFEATFEVLVEIILSEAGLPAYHYEMQHNQESMRHEFPTDTQHLQSIAHFKRTPINARAKQFPLPTYSLTQVLAAMADETPANDAYQTAHQSDIAQQLALSPRATLPTKVVECAINPVTAPSALPPEAILFNHWVDWAASDRYAVPVEFTPEGSTVPVRLTHQQAVALWIYATTKAREPDPALIPNYPFLTRVPPIVVNKVVRTPKPNISELRDIAAGAVPDAIISLILSTGATVPDQISSLEQFQQVCSQIYQGALYQYNLYSFQEDPQARGHAQAASLRLYADKVITLSLLQDESQPGLGVEYSTLLQQLGLNFNGYRPVDYYNTAIRILNAATGSDLTALLDPANVQQAMVNLLRYLSSYSIQIVTSGISELSTTVPRPDVRLSNVQFSEHEEILVDLEFATVLEAPFQESFSVRWLLDRILASGMDHLVPSFSVNLDPQVLSTSGWQENLITHVQVECGVVFGTSFDTDALWQSYTSDQRAHLVDVYS